jgi:hypothetical protein
LLAQKLGLLLRRLFERAGRQTAGRGLSDLLHQGQIDIEPRSLFPEGTSDNDLSPVPGDFGDAGQIIGRQLPCTHDEIILELRVWRRDELPNAYPMTCPLPRRVGPALPLRRGHVFGLENIDGDFIMRIEAAR